MKTNVPSTSARVAWPRQTSRRHGLTAVWLTALTAFPMVAQPAIYPVDDFIDPPDGQVISITNPPANFYRSSPWTLLPQNPLGLSRRVYLGTKDSFGVGVITVTANYYTFPGKFTLTSEPPGAPVESYGGIVWTPWPGGVVYLSGVDSIRWDRTNSQGANYSLTLWDASGRTNSVGIGMPAGSGTLSFSLQSFATNVDLASVTTIRLNVDTEVGMNVFIGLVELYVNDPANAIDIGLRAFDGTMTNRIACEAPGTGGALSSPLRIARHGTNYGILLVQTNAADASRIQVRTTSGVKAWKKLP